ncbi:hypothetical protein AAG906_038955 [Vitis piasezkii]
MFESFKKSMMAEFEMFQMKDCNPVNTPSEFGMKLNKDNGGKKVDDTLYKQIVGSLMYLTTTRPDIMHVVSVISRYMECPTEIHLLVAKRIFRYLQGTKEFGLFYKNGEKSIYLALDISFLEDLTNDGVINLIYCRSEDQIADILTKSLKFPTFQKFRKLLGVCTSNI